MNRIVADGRAAVSSPGKTVGMFSKALGAALIFGSSHTLAQETATSTPQANPPEPSPKESVSLKKKNVTKLGEVNVHGESVEPSSPKFTAPLLDTPMSVTILPQSLMQETAATSLQDALRNVPGITFAAGEGGTPTGDLPSIRGFSSTGNIYVDGLQDIGVQTRDIFDLDQVEIVKGPDSSIAGRAAGGGSINLVTKTAQPTNFVDVNGTYGGAGQYRSTFDGNYAFTSSIAARVNIMDMGGGVPGRDSAVRTDKVGFAPTITFGLQTPTRLILSWYHFEDNGTPDYGVPVDYANTGLPLTQTLGISTKNFYGLSDRDFRHNPVNSGTVRFEHDFSDAWTLRSQVRYTDSKNDYVLTLPMVSGNNDVYRLPIGNRDQTRSLAGGTDLFGHFDTGLIHHDVDIGFDAAEERERLAGEGAFDGYTVVSPAGVQGFSASGDCSDPSLRASYDCTNLYAPNPHDPWQGTITPATYSIADFKTTDWAPYAFDTITFSPQWKANVGVRWDRYHTESSDLANPLINTVEASSNKESFTSYQASVMYKPVSAGTIYLTTSTSLIPEDQASSNAGQDEVLKSTPAKPEKTRSLELGTKWNLFDNHLLLSGDVFVENHTDAPISITPDITEQIGKTRVKGVELSADGSITENWNLIAGYSHLDAKIIKGGLYDEVGQQVPNTPPNTFSLWSTYRVMPSVMLGAGAYYRDKQVGYAGPPDEYIDSYWRFDTMAKWQIDSHIALQLNVQNLFDRHYYSKDFYWYALPAPGRTYMASVDLKF